MRSDRRCARSAKARTYAAGDTGMVTAELAACLPVVVLLLAFVLSVSTVGSAAVRVQDAAREAARAAARGDDTAAHRLALDAAPGAAVSISVRSGEVTALVELRQHLLASWLPALTVVGRAVAAREPREPQVPP
jgi:Flp pilus assembly protein TadG